MQRTLFSVVLMIVLLVGLSTLAYADDVGDLDKLLQDVKVGQKLGQVNYIFLPKEAGYGSLQYEGQLGELKIRVFTRKDNNEEIVYKVDAVLDGRKNEAWVSTILKYLDKPTKKDQGPLDTKYEYEGPVYRWNLVLFDRLYNVPPANVFVYSLKKTN